MTCSIEIIRRKDPKSECKYVDIGEREQLDIEVERCLLDLYEKIGILKERIEKLERGR